MVTFRRPILLQGTPPPWKVLLEKMRSRVQKKVYVPSTPKQVHFHVTLAVVSVMTGGFAFIGALVLRDAMKDSLESLTSKFKKPWIKTVTYLVLGIVVAIGGTLVFSIIQHNTQNMQLKHESEEMLRREQRDLCNSIYLELLREKDALTMEKYLKDATLCYNYGKMVEHVRMAKKDQIVCNDALHLLKSSTSVDRMAEVVEKHAGCYNKDAMQAYLDIQRERLIQNEGKRNEG